MGPKPLAFHLLQYLPRKHFSRLCGQVADLPLPGILLQPLIRTFAWAFGVDWSEAALPPGAYRNFTEFFTRELKPGMRPIASGETTLISPVDGTIGQYGTIRDGRLIQAKGIDYSVEALLGDPERARRYEGGEFLTIYLAPHNYHRIHSMVDGEVQAFSYIPGDLWTVSPLGVEHVEGLFAVNERLTSFITTSAGECALVKVGATVVGRIRVRYDGQISNRPDATTRHAILNPAFPIRRGEELGQFELGSTVVLLFQPGQVEWGNTRVGQPIRLGEALGRFHYHRTEDKQ
jgi:phosphatidylserine decarboxylase